MASLVEDRDRLAEDPFVLPHDAGVSAANLVRPIDEPSFLRRDLFVLAEPRCQHAKALCVSTEALCWLSEGLLSLTTCGCKASEVLGSPAMALCMLAKDLWRMPKIFVPQTTGFHQRQRDHVFSAKGLREKPKDVYQKPDDVSSLTEGICPYPRVLVQETAFPFRWNKGHSVISKSRVSRSKRFSHVSTPLRPESETLFVEPEPLGRQGAVRSATNLAPSTYLGAQGAISSDGKRRFVGRGVPPSGAQTLEAVALTPTS